MAADASPTRPHLVRYAQDWPERGTALLDGLGRALAPLALHLDHIGSTSISGMAAKPVFDLQVSVLDLAAAEDSFEGPLAERGFRKSGHRYDHVPAGLDEGRENWTKRLWSRRGHTGEDVNLHVRVLGSPNERLALLFRDWFRAHPEAVPAYARFKDVLAGTVGDIDTYSDVKDPVVDLVIAVAEPWATATGWTPHR